MNVDCDAVSKSSCRTSVNRVADEINGYSAQLNYFGDAADFGIRCPRVVKEHKTMIVNVRYSSFSKNKIRSTRSWAVVYHRFALRLMSCMLDDADRLY